MKWTKEQEDKLCKLCFEDKSNAGVETAFENLYHAIRTATASTSAKNARLYDRIADLLSAAQDLLDSALDDASRSK